MGGGGAWGIGDGNSVCNGIIVDLFLQVPMTVISMHLICPNMNALYLDKSKRCVSTNTSKILKYIPICMEIQLTTSTEPILRTTFWNCFFQLKNLLLFFR